MNKVNLTYTVTGSEKPQQKQPENQPPPGMGNPLFRVVTTVYDSGNQEFQIQSMNEEKFIPTSQEVIGAIEITKFGVYQMHLTQLVPQKKQ